MNDMKNKGRAVRPHRSGGGGMPRREAGPVSALSQFTDTDLGEAYKVEIEIKIKREMFRFKSKLEWINKAQGWFSTCEVGKSNYIAIDATGVVCRIGKQFNDAEEKKSYPVVVYELDG